MTAVADGRTAPRPALGERLVAWQRRHGRHDLPWQRTREPYRVWLSEVMLQQTQVATVRGYYARFVERFPDVATLAEAPLDDVLAAWSGLGYYSRARNLHRAARVVVADHGGVFPPTAAALSGLPGVGRSTAAAIAAACFGERVSILDGNARRVLARLFAFEADARREPAMGRLWRLAETLLPPRDVDVYNQALMDLGAGVCTPRRPNCGACPWHDDCAARRSGDVERYPVRAARPRRGRRSNALLWLRRGAQHWLVRRPPTGVWGGLWSLPEYADADALGSVVARWPGRGVWLPPIEHALTHFDWTLVALRWDWPADAPAVDVDADSGRWATRDEALALGLPAPVRGLLV